MVRTIFPRPRLVSMARCASPTCSSGKVCRVDEPAAIASLVRAGLGVALVGNCGGPNSPLNLLRIEFPVCQRNFQIVWHEKRYLSLAARKFRDFLIRYFAESAEAG
jgi:LysR family transcriptional activator of glutamate synthase operon